MSTIKVYVHAVSTFLMAGEDVKAGGSFGKWGRKGEL